MHAAALPRRAKYPPDGRFQTLVRIRDHQFHATQATARQALEKPRPEGLGLRGADVQSNDLPLALGVDCDSNYCRHSDNAAALPLLQVGRVQPEIGPIAGERTVEERMHPLVDV